MIGLTSPGDSPHVRGLLHISLAHVQVCLGRTSSACGAIIRALEYARGSMVSDPKQAERIYKQASELSKKLKFPLGEEVEKEYVLARMLSCSADQELKAGLG